jgi:hypothetical protein
MQTEQPFPPAPCVLEFRSSATGLWYFSPRAAGWVNAARCARHPDQFIEQKEGESIFRFGVRTGEWWLEHKADIAIGNHHAAIEEVRKEAPPVPPPSCPVLPKDPPLGLLMSMAVRSDHGLGCPGYYDQPLLAKPGVTHAMRLEATLRNMSQIYEEVAGHGFYSPDKEPGYVDMYDAARGEPNQTKQTTESNES